MRQVKPDGEEMEELNSNGIVIIPNQSEPLYIPSKMLATWMKRPERKMPSTQ
jgi:hypothetical protein